MQRRGFSLIEMLVVITASSVLLGIAVCLLILLLRAEKTGRDRVGQAGVSAQLVGQFRADAHDAKGDSPIFVDHGFAAVPAKIGTVPQIKADVEPPAECRFALADGRTVTYRVLPGEVERTESASGKPLRQESYTLPAGYSATVVVEADATPPVASLTLRGDGTPTVGNRETRIVAALGKDHRFANAPEGSR